MSCQPKQEESKDIRILEPIVTIKSTLNEQSKKQLKMLSDELLKDNKQCVTN